MCGLINRSQHTPTGQLANQTMLPQVGIRFILFQANFTFLACAYINSDGYWYDGTCNAVRSVVCKQLPIGLNYSCACLGKSDTAGLGGSCGYWNGSSSAWCYVNQVILRIVRGIFLILNNEGMSRGVSSK